MNGKLTIGFSPCPNDTFIFDALVNKKIDTGDLQFEPVLEDVQTLNEWAIEGRLDITKISYGVLPVVCEHYSLLQSGGALGKGVGPLLIAKYPVQDIDKINKMQIAIPGANTTAHVLFSLAFPEARNKQFRIFSRIEDAILNDEVDAGVIIHENRFTYHQKGLVKILDLGEYWERQTGLPIPLGGIIARKSFSNQATTSINTLIRQSIEFAFANYPQLSEYVRQHSQEMNEVVMRQHVELYVNNYSVELGKEGLQAVKRFLQIYADINKEAVKDAVIL